MFDNNVFTLKDSWEEAKELRKLKKILLNKTRSEFSDLEQYRYDYYLCVNNILKDEQIKGKFLDHGIISCKIRMNSVKNLINELNKHAQIKVNRCINSKREMHRKLNFDMKSEEKALWTCMNNYHRRYLFYYPNEVKSKWVN